MNKESRITGGAKMGPRSERSATGAVRRSRRHASLLLSVTLLTSAAANTFAPVASAAESFVDADLTVLSYNTRTHDISLQWSNASVSSYNILATYGWLGPEVDSRGVVMPRRGLEGTGYLADGTGASSFAGVIDPYEGGFYVQIQWSCYGDGCPGGSHAPIYSEPVFVSGGDVEPEPELKKGMLSIADAAMFEGESGGLARVMQFRVSLTWPSDATAADKNQIVTVRYSTTNGSATAGGDYTAVAGSTLTFEPGYKSLLAPVTLVGDGTQEADESFTVTLSQPTNATITKESATGSIYDNDGPEVTGPTGGPQIAALAGGNVTITPLNGAAAAAGAGTILNPGDTLRNTGTTPATVDFPDRSSVILAPEATLQWKDDPTLFNQPRGTVWYSLIPHTNLAWGVGTRFATLAVRGTTFTVHDTGVGDRVQVYDGSVDATGTGAKVVAVGEGKQTFCADGDACTAATGFTESPNPFWEGDVFGAPVISKLSDRPDPWKPTRDGKTLHKIYYTMSEQGNVLITWYFKGRLDDKYLYRNASKSGWVSWNGLTDNGKLAPAGRWTYTVVATDKAGYRSEEVGGTFVLKR